MSVAKYRLITIIVALGVSALGIGAQRGSGGGGPQTAGAVPTPHTPDGHPDLSGLWNGRGGGAGGGLAGTDDIDRTALGAQLGARGIEPLILAARVDERSTGYENLERDWALRLRLRSNIPLYKPQYWQTVRNLDHNSNEDDPGFHCMPAGVPRTGAPAKIVQTPTELIFLHPGQGGAIAVVDTYRVIPIDGRPHKPLEETDGTWNGDSVGHWEGDTMVIDTVNFVTSTWLAQGGYFHSENMHVIERLHRDGSTLTWQATVEDPDVLLKPWVMDMVTRRLNPDPKALLPETLACSERDAAHSATKDHH
jgi:hypothetical protein